MTRRDRIAAAVVLAVASAGAAVVATVLPYPLSLGASILTVFAGGVAVSALLEARDREVRRG